MSDTEQLLKASGNNNMCNVTLFSISALEWPNCAIGGDIVFEKYVECWEATSEDDIAVLLFFCSALHWPKHAIGDIALENIPNVATPCRGKCWNVTETTSRDNGNALVLIFCVDALDLTWWHYFEKDFQWKTCQTTRKCWNAQVLKRNASVET